MSDAARLASQTYAQKPSGTPHAHFPASAAAIASIQGVLSVAIEESAYAAVISYAEAISGLQHGSISWSIVKLYYSSFYSLRGLMLLNNVVPFNSGGEMILDMSAAKFLKGGRSSHHWNWPSIRRIPQLSASWFVSADSQEAYEKLRKHRENVNYTHAFTDPLLHSCLVSGEPDLAKRFRAYRDDMSFLYTYLVDHLAVAYPTQLIFSLDAALQSASISLSEESVSHAKKIWRMKDRCPIS